MFRIDLFSDAHSLLTDTHLQKLLAAAKQPRRANIKDIQQNTAHINTNNKTG
jgi:hypothetical protein